MIAVKKYFAQRLFSFKNAFNGIGILYKNESNFRLHIIAIFIVLILGFILHLNKTEWVGITLIITAVILAEAFNTAIEYISDFISPNYHNSIKQIKDISAAAVLVTSFGAIIIGLIIFLNKIL